MVRKAPLIVEDELYFTRRATDRICSLGGFQLPSPATSFDKLTFNSPPALDRKQDVLPDDARSQGGLSAWLFACNSKR